MLYNVERHLWRTKDGRLVPTGDLDAWILAYAKGDQIPEEIALREGLISSGVPPEPPPDPVVVEPVVVEPVGDVVPSEVAVTTDNPPADLGEQPAVTPAPRKRAARKKVSGVTINRRSGGTADG